MRVLLFRAYLYYRFRRLSSMSRRDAWSYSRGFITGGYDDWTFYGARYAVEDDMDYWEVA